VGSTGAQPATRMKRRARSKRLGSELCSNHPEQETAEYETDAPDAGPVPNLPDGDHIKTEQRRFFKKISMGWKRSTLLCSCACMDVQALV
jgi:hypothetical protein